MSTGGPERPARKPAILKKRAEFLRVRGGARVSRPAFAVEVRPAPASGAGPPRLPRFGLTVTKEVGSAVVRNRIRRRLKAALAGKAAGGAQMGFDYVIFARRVAMDMPFSDLEHELARAIAEVHTRQPRRDQGRRKR